MGAFGRMLIRYWGGDLNAYDGVSNVKESPKVKTNENFEEEDDIKFEGIKNFCENLITRGETMISNLTDDKANEIFHTEKYNKKFEIWRKKFLKKIGS